MFTLLSSPPPPVLYDISQGPIAYPFNLVPRIGDLVEAVYESNKWPEIRISDEEYKANYFGTKLARKTPGAMTLRIFIIIQRFQVEINRIFEGNELEYEIRNWIMILYNNPDSRIPIVQGTIKTEVSRHL